MGVLLPLTGADAAIGQGLRNSIRLAAAEVNARGGIQGRRLELVEVDDGSLPEKAAAAAATLVRDPRVLAVLGSVGYSTYRAVQRIFGEPRMPFLPAGVTDRDVLSVALGAYPAEFALLPFGTTQMDRMAKYAWDVLGDQSFVYVRDDTDEATKRMNHFRLATATLLHALQTSEIVIRSAADVPEAVARLKASAPPFVLYAGPPDKAATLLHALRQAGVTSAFQHAWLQPSQALIDGAKDDAEGALAVFPGVPAEDFPAGRAFSSAYAGQAFDVPPGPLGIFGYAEAQALFAAMDRSFLTRASIAGALKNEELPTAVGPIRFTYVGSTYQTVAIYRVTHGRWTPISLALGETLAPYVPR